MLPSSRPRLPTITPLMIQSASCTHRTKEGADPGIGTDTGSARESSSITAPFMPCMALREQGIEAHIVNNNPETVSTDYDTSDKLFFEPVTLEDVMNIIEKERPYGVLVQFGGQTAINLAIPLEKEIARMGLNTKILGTTPDSIDLAEDRERFNMLMQELNIPQPNAGIAFSPG